MFSRFSYLGEAANRTDANVSYLNIAPYPLMLLRTGAKIYDNFNCLVTNSHFLVSQKVNKEGCL